MSKAHGDWDQSQVRGVTATADSEVDDEPETEPARVDRKTIGRYELCFELASGGMATVYLARVLGPVGFEKLVALKRIHPHLAKNRRYINMFMDEARIASRISHSNVCSVFDHGEVDGEFFIAMEYLVGEPMTAVCKTLAHQSEITSWPRFPFLIARMIADAAEGLHAAHELTDSRGQLMHVVHRDVSPHNLFVSYDGVVRVVDFGIARARSRLQHTATGEFKGKLAYMSPEQINGTEVDRRADVWSLGVVLWELLSGRRLFRRDSPPDTIRAVISDPIAPPSSFRPNVPKEFDRIVMNALGRRADDRYPTARGFAQELLYASGQRGQSVGLGDLAALMDRLFPGGRARRRQLVTIASAAQDQVPVVADPELASHSTVGTVAEALAPRRRMLRYRRLGFGLGAVGVGAALAIVAGLLEHDSPKPLSAAPPETEHPAVTPEPLKIEPPVLTQVPTATLDEARAPVEPPAADGGEHVEQRPPRAATGAPTRPRAARVKTTAPAIERSVAQAPSPTNSVSTQAPQESQTGTLSITTPGGWANVYDARGRFWGATPLRRTLPAGEHALELRPFGQPPPIRLRVMVIAGQANRLVRPLTAD